MFESLTKYKDKIAAEKSVGRWAGEKLDKDGRVLSLEVPFVEYCPCVEGFMDALEKFDKQHPEFRMMKYVRILQSKKICWGKESMKRADVSHMDDKTVLALLMGLMRGELFCPGIIKEYAEEGHLCRWLQRLQDIDAYRAKRKAK